jgi:LPXTG-site transpeptidase (sortase) family protein
MHINGWTTSMERRAYEPAVPWLPTRRLAGALLISTAFLLTSIPGTQPAVATVPLVDSISVPTPDQRSSAPWVSAPKRLRIPKIGVNSSMMPLGLQRNGSLQVPPDALTSGWFAGGPRPGKVGPAVIAAHVHWNGRWAVFQRLSNLKYGDKIHVDRRDGSTVTFRVTRVGHYKKTAFPTKLVYGNLTYPGLRLITCDSFDYTRRAYMDNIVVFAVPVTPKSSLV